MIIKQYIKDFEAMEFGMFVHFGLYSELGRGEWAKDCCNISNEEYESLADKFNPEADWAPKLVATAKAAGCKYITLTTRHHDGYSLFDTKGLSDFDAPHCAAGRDLIREFVDACNAEGIVPFFYHTLLDWHEPTYKTDFKAYLKYLRRSVEILCTEYGKIGGLWFDGWWDKPDEDWEFDELYGLIRRNQPTAMIINNTGLGRLGEKGHPEIDSVTFERGRPLNINTPDAPKYVASEMCQIFGDHWGYAALDFNFKSMATIIQDYCCCRSCGSNFLLNVGPKGNGYLRPLDTAMLTTLGDWIELMKEAVVGTRPSGIEVDGEEGDFIMKGNGAYYLFCNNLTQRGDPNVVKQQPGASKFRVAFKLSEKIKSVSWLYDGDNLDFTQDGDEVVVTTKPREYGESMVVKVAKIEI